MPIAGWPADNVVGNNGHRISCDGRDPASIKTPKPASKHLSPCSADSGNPTLSEQRLPALDDGSLTQRQASWCHTPAIAYLPGFAGCVAAPNAGIRNGVNLTRRVVCENRYGCVVFVKVGHQGGSSRGERTLPAGDIVGCNRHSGSGDYSRAA